MEKLYELLNLIDGKILWGIPMIILILASGIFLSVRSKFLQVRKFGACMKHTVGGTVKQMKKKEKKTKDPNAITPFEAFATAVSGTVGTGNIVGVTTAIISGGPGAVFWMWISAFFGMFTKFAEIVLSLFYRKKDNKGEFIGGPMLYIENGIKQKWLAILFAIFTVLAAIGMGSVQANTIQNTWKAAFEIPTWVTALIVAVFTALIVIGGLKRLGKAASMIVPFMIVLFLVMALILIIVNATAIPAAIGSIFSSAFSPKSALGGFMGYGISQAMRYGFARGIFSNEAGLGSASIAHATADTKEPVEQGLWGIFEVFVDTFIVCTLTALFILTSQQVVNGDSDATLVAMNAFSLVLGKVGTITFSIVLPLFAFSTILAWSLYGVKATQYLFQKHQKGAGLAFNILYIAIIIGLAFVTFFFGDNLGADFVWLISDMTNALMAIPNLIALVCLSGVLCKIVKNYFDRKKGLNVAPMLSAYDGNNDFINKK